MAGFNINGVQLHCRIAGRGEPLLLLHGLGSSSLDWERQIRVYSERFRVIAPDLRGFGYSAKPPGPYTIDLFAQDMYGLLARLDVEACHVLGYSMGGAVALQMAVNEPERLRSMILVNCLASYEVDRWAKHWFVLVRMAMARLAGMERMARFGAKRLFPEPHQEHLRRTMIERHRLNESHAYLAALYALKGWSVRAQLPGLSMPTLVIAADMDYTPVEETADYVATLPNARLEIVRNSRHGTPFDQPARFDSLVLGFLDEHRAAPARLLVWWRRLIARDAPQPRPGLARR